MAKYFKTGDTIPIKSGGEAKIISKLGEGGQGVVYKVQYNGKPYALKWYLPGKIKDTRSFYKNLENNIKVGSPTDSFLWPQHITEQYNGSFGYLMDLRQPEYHDFSDFLLRKTHFESYQAAINACLNIVQGFGALHSKGFSYQDLNDGNFFINPKNGDVLICDNDNVAPDRDNLGIAGKCRYMAPEVVTRKKLPDRHTDRFSLAVILFYMLFLSHPLEGSATTKMPCMTEVAEQQFYGTDPIFIYDDSGANYPVPGVHDNAIKFWARYPKFIQETFKKAFSKELMTGNDITHRISESEWQKIFVKLRDHLVVCPYCGSYALLGTGKNGESNCINCKSALPSSFVMQIRGKTIDYDIVMYPQKKLYRCHIDMLSNDFNEIVGEVLLSKTTPPKLGLKNVSGTTWIVENANGTQTPLDSGKVVVLGRGVRVIFNADTRAEIV